MFGSQLEYIFGSEVFTGRIYLPPIVVRVKVKIKAKGVLEFELIDWNGSVSITEQYVIYY